MSKTAKFAQIKRFSGFGICQYFHSTFPTSQLFRQNAILEQPKLANVLYAKAQSHKCKFNMVLLKHDKGKGKFAVDTRWKVVVNEQIEVDDL